MIRGSRSFSLFGIVLSSAIGCGKCSSAPSSATAGGGQAEPQAEQAPIDSREAAQWAAAAQGDPEELMRLEGLVGCDGLRDRATRRDLRVTAVLAMQYCHDLSLLPLLAELASAGSDTEAQAALGVIRELAARRRLATDPEDALELRAGCSALLALARATSRPRDRRAAAVSAIRMLADRGCVQRAEIPTDLDLK
jgi:hypothetical protein